MSYFDNSHEDIDRVINQVPPHIAEIIRLDERAKVFSKFRNLIYEKQAINDEVAENVLGWAYERLAE